jgi:hypothetical protein
MNPGSWLCKLGIHEWEQLDFLVGDPVSEKLKRCKRCGWGEYRTEGRIRDFCPENMEKYLKGHIKSLKNSLKRIVDTENKAQREEAERIREQEQESKPEPAEEVLFTI